MKWASEWAKATPSTTPCLRAPIFQHGGPEYVPDVLIISLGVDTFETDPISFFKLKSDDFTTYGADIGSLHLPTLFVMEGGYDIAEIGVNTVNVLQGFESVS